VTSYNDASKTKKNSFPVINFMISGQEFLLIAHLKAQNAAVVKLLMI